MKTDLFTCPKCGTEKAISRTIKEKRDGTTEVRIYRCGNENCKYQSGIKEINDLYEKP